MCPTSLHCRNESSSAPSSRRTTRRLLPRTLRAEKHESRSKERRTENEPCNIVALLLQRRHHRNLQLGSLQLLRRGWWGILGRDVRPRYTIPSSHISFRTHGHDETTHLVTGLGLSLRGTVSGNVTLLGALRAAVARSDQLATTGEQRSVRCSKWGFRLSGKRRPNVRAKVGEEQREARKWTTRRGRDESWRDG